MAIHLLENGAMLTACNRYGSDGFTSVGGAAAKVITTADPMLVTCGPCAKAMFTPKPKQRVREPDPPSLFDAAADTAAVADPNLARSAAMAAILTPDPIPPADLAGGLFDADPDDDEHYDPDEEDGIPWNDTTQPFRPTFPPVTLENDPLDDPKLITERPKENCFVCGKLTADPERVCQECRDDAIIDYGNGILKDKDGNLVCSGCNETLGDDHQCPDQAMRDHFAQQNADDDLDDEPRDAHGALKSRCLSCDNPIDEGLVCDPCANKTGPDDADPDDFVRGVYYPATSDGGLPNFSRGFTMNETLREHHDGPKTKCHSCQRDTHDREGYCVGCRGSAVTRVYIPHKDRSPCWFCRRKDKCDLAIGAWPGSVPYVCQVCVDAATFRSGLRDSDGAPFRQTITDFIARLRAIRERFDEPDPV